VPENLPHVVIVGAGFGGLRVARALRRTPVRVTLVDRRNYHLFQPLLYQVATAGLSPEDIAHPVRAIFRRQRNLSFRLAEVLGVDLAAGVLETSTGSLAYDWLVLAPGGASHFFGLESVARNGLPLKEIEDAVAIRNQVLRMFETAVQERDPDRRRGMLNFVVVGGGPTGVESAGALSELIRLVLTKDFPDLNVKDVRVILLEATDRLLGAMPERLREVTAEILWRKHVEVRFGAEVTRFDGERVALRGEEVIPTRTLIWAAGVRAAPLASGLGAELGPQGRVRVGPGLRLPASERVFVIGDAAYLEDESGAALPMMAPVAQQQADHVARSIRGALRGEPEQPFRYRNPGSMATIGRNAAVVHVKGLAFSGFFAWVAWLLLHIVLLIGFRNRLLVLINWAWDYFLYDRAVRLIYAREIHTAPAAERRAQEGAAQAERSAREGAAEAERRAG
jgi:NADH:quinone reductase (non-electrogenic)